MKTNAARLLERMGIAFEVREYEVDEDDLSAPTVARKVGLEASQVFKTLVVLADDPKRKPMLVVVPGPDALDLKAFAKESSAKKARMAGHDEAEALTGLQTGGISALALINKGFDVYLDAQAQAFATIAVSAGQRGANVELPVADFVRLTRARWVRLR